MVGNRASGFPECFIMACAEGAGAAADFCRKLSTDSHFGSPAFAYIFKRFPMFAQTFVAREIEGLARHGVEPLIYSMQQPEDAARQEGFAALEARVRTLPSGMKLSADIMASGASARLPAGAFLSGRWLGRRARRRREALWLGPRLRAAGVRHVHTHFVGPSAATAWWLRRDFGITYSITAHANDFLSDDEEAPGRQALMREAEFVVAVSDFSRRLLMDNFSGARIVRVYNGMSLEGFPERRPSDPPLLVSVGRLVEKKGFADLIEVCRLLRAQGVEVRCKIIGDGPLEGDLRSRISGAGLDGAVELAGPQAQPQIRAALAEASAFVLPCVEEKTGGMDILPTVIMEAMAARVPVVSTTLAGIPEMVVEGKTGFLVAPGDVAAAAAAVRALLGDPDKARAMGEAGFRHAASMFSEDVTIPQLLGLLRTAAAR